MICAEDGYMTLYEGTFDNRSEEFVIESSTALEYEDYATRAAVNPGDDLRLIIKHGLLDKVSGQLHKWGDALELCTLGRLPIGSCISDLGTLIAVTGNAVLMDGAGEDFVDEALETMQGETSSFITGKVMNAITAGIVKVKFKRTMVEEERVLAMYLTKFSVLRLHGLVDLAISAITDEQVEEETYSVFNRSRKLTPVMEYTYDYSKCPYNLSVDIKGVTKHSAQFVGSCEYVGYGGPVGGPELVVIDQGYIYREYSTNSDVYEVSENMAPKVVFLQPASEYMVWSYVNTLVKEWKSPKGYHFYTKGTKIQVTPDYVSCGLDGGITSLKVEIGAGAKLRIKNKPSWCEIVPVGDNTFLVSVGPHAKDRSGEIVFETTSYYQEVETHAVKVTQIGVLPWNGTSWLFKWPSDCEAFLAGGKDWDIQIESVERGVYWSYLDAGQYEAGTHSGPGQIFDLSAGPDNTLILYSYVSGSIFGRTYAQKHRHIISRIDEDHASLLWHTTQYTNGVVDREYSYTLPGTRVKE